MSRSLRLKRKCNQILVMKGQGSETFLLQSFKNTEGKRQAALSTIYKFPLHVALVPLSPKFDGYLNAVPFPPS